MAGPLTWRNVDAPDFRGSMAGFRESNDMLTTALSNISRGIGNFRDQNMEISDRDAQLRAAAIQDPEAMKLALQNGSLFSGDESSKAISSIGSRVSDLLAQKSTEQNVAQTGYNNARGIAQDVALDGFRDQAGQIGLGDGTKASINQIISTPEGAAAWAKLDSNQRLAMVNKNNDVRKTDQGILAGDQSAQSRAMSNSMQAFNNTNQVSDYNDGKVADDLYARLKSESPDANYALRNIESLRNSGKASTNQIKLLIERAKGDYGDVYASPEKGGPTGTGLVDSPAMDWNDYQPGSGGSSFAANIPYDETRNYVSKIMGKAGNVTGSNEEKAAKLLPHLIQQESGGRDNVTSSAGAQGRTQVMPATGTDPGFGVKPMGAQTPQEFERFGKDYLKAMLDKYDGDVPKALAAYNAGPGTVDGWTGNKQSAANPAQQLLAAARPAASASEIPDLPEVGLAGKLPPNTAAIGDAAQVTNSIQNRNMQEGALLGTAAARLRNSWGKDDISTQKVAVDLAKNWGADQATVNDELQRIQQLASDNNTPINATHAGAILEDSLKSEDDLTRGFTPKSWWGLENGQKVNEDRLKANIKLLGNKDLNAMASTQSRDTSAATIQTTLAALTAAETSYNAIAMRASDQPSYRKFLEPAARKVQLARAQHQMAMKGGNGESNRSLQAPPPPPPPAPVAQTQGTPVNGPAPGVVRSLDPSGFSLNFR